MDFAHNIIQAQYPDIKVREILAIIDENGKIEKIMEFISNTLNST